MEIESELKDKVEIEFVGGHYDIFIMHCSRNVFRERLVQEFVESFFSLPLLARIEHTIFDQSISSYYPISNQKNSTVEISLFDDFLESTLDEVIPDVVSVYSISSFNNTPDQSIFYFF